MITMLILIINMWWKMFTGEGFIHGDTASYLAASLCIAFVEVMAISTLKLKENKE